MTGLRSSQAADAAGVNLQTLRHYERRGLLAEPDRSLGGHRLYPPEAVTVLKVIKAAQRLGFTLDEVAALLTAGGHRHGRPDAGLRQRAQEKLTEVEAKIANLQVIAATLRTAVAAGCDLGTKGGLLTDEHARVLDTDRQPIAGPYAFGNTNASVMGRTYPGPGATASDRYATSPADAQLPRKAGRIAATMGSMRSAMTPHGGCDIDHPLRSCTSGERAGLGDQGRAGHQPHVPTDA